ncbi:MAG: CoA transferase [Acidobacteriota bacterium]
MIDGEAPEKPPAHRPLEGVLVVDLSRYLPGPLTSRLLGDLGARVIKIEEPKLGDPTRQAPPLVEAGGRSSLTDLLLTGHESVALDIKKPMARDLLEELLMSADVMIESLRPGTLAEAGLDPAELRRLYPRLIACSVSGWGQDGNYAWRAGHDLAYQAVAGSLAAGGGMPAVQSADLVGGWSAALAITSALHRRHLTGEGCWIDQALLDAAGHASITALAAEADGPKAVAQPLMLTGALAGYDLYRTRDGGTLALAALEPKYWRRWCLALGRRDLVLKQASSSPEVARQVAELVASKSREEWADFLAEHDVPGEPVLSVSESLEHPQVRHRAYAWRTPDGPLRLGYPAKIDGERPRTEGEAPGLGEHTDAVISEFSLGGAALGGGLSRRRGGVGQRFSWRRLAGRVAGKWAQGRRGEPDPED